MPPWSVTTAEWHAITHMFTTAVADSSGFRDENAPRAVDGAKDSAGDSAARNRVVENGCDVDFE